MLHSIMKGQGLGLLLRAACTSREQGSDAISPIEDLSPIPSPVTLAMGAAQYPTSLGEDKVGD